MGAAAIRAQNRRQFATYQEGLRRARIEAFKEQLAASDQEQGISPGQRRLREVTRESLDALGLDLVRIETFGQRALPGGSDASGAAEAVVRSFQGSGLPNVGAPTGIERKAVREGGRSIDFSDPRFGDTTTVSEEGGAEIKAARARSKAARNDVRLAQLAARDPDGPLGVESTPAERAAIAAAERTANATEKALLLLEQRRLRLDPNGQN